jgi:hypothetical protein
LQNVTGEAQIIELTGIALIGRTHASGVRFNDTWGSTLAWTGQILDTAGFNLNSPNPGGVPFTEYVTYIQVPSRIFFCPSQYPSCVTFLWGGIGGYPSASTSLIQSGWSGNYWTGGSFTEIFYEFEPGPAYGIPTSQLPAGALQPGQLFQTAGWASNQDGSPNPAAPYASFSFFGPDTGGNWSASMPGIRAPSTPPFTGQTSEAIEETPAAPVAQLRWSSTIEFIPYAYDVNNNEYIDQNTPWIFVNTVDSSNVLMSYPYFAGDPNLPPSSPYTNDPFDQSRVLVPFQVNWYSYQ